MVFEDQSAKRKRILTGGAVALLLLFLISFSKELYDIGRVMLIRAANILLILPLELPEDISPLSGVIVSYTCLAGFLVVFMLWLLIISQQSILPVRSFSQIQRTAFNLLMFILRMNGSAVFVRDGKTILSEEDDLREGPGVVVVDFNSAVVLEERVGNISLAHPLAHLFITFAEMLGLVDRRKSPRSCGPGVVFTRPRERIRGVVDLRRQFRIERSVTCYTREGIELKANILCGFTVGQRPDVLWVTYIGERRYENLRVVTLEEQRTGEIKVTGISSADELDEFDKKEIHHFARWKMQEGLRGNPVWQSYTPIPALSSTPEYDEERVFAAVFAQARSNTQELLSWSDLPTRVAADFYREILPQINYDDLYNINGSGSLPLFQYKRKLRTAMRNNGVLSYRLVLLQNDDLCKGLTYAREDLLVTETQVLKNSKILRDRGIKITFSSFGDPVPVNEAVYRQRLDAWKARWESELQINRAERELNVMRVSSQAYAATQKQMVDSLVRILEQPEHSDEAIAMRVLQSLENITADTKTSELVPRDVLDLMRTVYGLLRAPGLPH